MYRLKRLRGGGMAVHNSAYGETMHPLLAPWAEANRLYVQGGDLAALLTDGAAGEAVVFDVGLGAAANALAALHCHRQLLGRNRAVRPLRLISFEADPAALRFAIDQAPALEYPRGHEATLQALLDDGCASLPGGARWELRLGDFTRLIHDEPARADLIFFDPFSPRSNPEMWRVSTLEGLYRCRRPGAATRLVTYSSAIAIRAALLLAGFYAGEGPRLGPQHRTTAAATHLSALAEPLTKGWLARWRHAREPWPPLTRVAEHKRARETLLAHPQWSHEGLPAPRPSVARRGPRRSGRRR